MRLCSFTRLFAAAGTVLFASPALGADADLAVTLTLATEADPRTAGISVGGTVTFDVEVTNNGPTHVTEFQVDVAKDAALSFGDVTGCDPLTDTQTDPFPCKVSIPAGLIAGTSTTFTFDLAGPAKPKTDAARDAATCPSAPGPAPIYATILTVSNAKQDLGAGPVAVNDPNGSNDSDSATTHLRDWADLEVVSLEGPGSTSEGQQVQYTTTVANHGPCDAVRVRLTTNFAFTLSFVSTDVCSNAATMGDDGFCSLGTLAKGTTTAIHTTMQVNTFPKSVIKASIPVDVSIASRTRAASAGPPPVTAAPATDDPLQSNTATLTHSSNAADTIATVDLSSNDSGCSTGGAGTLVGLLSLVALRLARRRSS